MLKIREVASTNGYIVDTLPYIIGSWKGPKMLPSTRGILTKRFTSLQTLLMTSYGVNTNVMGLLSHQCSLTQTSVYDVKYLASLKKDVLGPQHLEDFCSFDNTFWETGEYHP